jgi:DNA-directed RNA polymerase subunit M/transcription elongation factor TFIIS
MFKIPLEHDFDLLTNDQKIELENAITKFEDNYISNNRLSIKFKNSIGLDKYLDIKYNILNSATLLNKINSNEIEIKLLPWLDPYQLDPILWQQHIDKRDKNRETIEKMATINIFKCRKCGEMKCTTYQLQTASIDEPMTTFISCKICGNSWKV